jgi:hypothetical protein
LPRGGVHIYDISDSSGGALGNVNGVEYCLAQSFQLSENTTVTSASLCLASSVATNDEVIKVEVMTDSGGLPSGLPTDSS